MTIDPSSRVNLRHRFGGCDRGANAELRDGHAMQTQQQRRPCAAGDQYAGGFDQSGLGPHAADPASGNVEAAGGAVFDDRGALACCEPRKGRHGKPGFRPHVRRGRHRPMELARHAGNERRRLGRTQQSRIDIVPGGDRHEVVEIGHLLCRMGEISDAGLLEADILAAFFRKLLPQPAGFYDDRQLVRIAPLLADPAPVPRRLFRRDPPLFDKRHRDALFRKVKRRRDSDHATADDHHIRAFRDRVGKLDRVAFGKGEVGHGMLS
ncbi:hypothetical protein D3C73_792970 [compost metagenome]